MSHHARKPGGGRVSTGLVALGSAAVVAIYSAGFLKTKAAAARFEDPRAQRRAAVPPGVIPPGVVPAPATVARTDAIADPVQPAGAAAAGIPQPAVTLAIPTVPANRPTATASMPETSTAAAAATPAVAGTPAAPAAPAAASAPTGSSPATTAPQVPVAAAPAVPAVTPVPAVATALPAAKYKDGTYSGWGSCRHGDLQATLVVAEGRITSAVISQCLTRYNCSWISPLPPQVVQRQSPEVDYVSGATDSAIAFYNALVDALSKAK